MSWNYYIGRAEYFRGMYVNRFTSLDDYLRSMNYLSVMQSLVIQVRELVTESK